MTKRFRQWLPLCIVVAAMGLGIILVKASPDLATKSDWSKHYRCTDDDKEQAPLGELTCKGMKPNEEHAKEVFEKRLQHYERDLEQLRTTLWLQLIIMIFAFVVLWTKPKEIEVPIVKLRVPAKWIHVAVPVALVYLSVGLGYVFDHLIQERYFLWQEILSLEGGKGISIHSFGPLLDDRWVMDIWFAEFHPDSMSNSGAETSTPVTVIRYVMLFGFGAFIAALQVSILALLERSKFPKQRRWTVIWAFCFVSALAVLMLNQVAFWTVGGNDNWVQWLAIEPLTVIGYGAWIWTSIARTGREQAAADLQELNQAEELRKRAEESGGDSGAIDDHGGEPR
jgi:hypothetical protein